jgi:hypothetical protein
MSKKVIKPNENVNIKFDIDKKDILEVLKIEKEEELENRFEEIKEKIEQEFIALVNKYNAKVELNFENLLDSISIAKEISFAYENIQYRIIKSLCEDYAFKQIKHKKEDKITTDVYFDHIVEYDFQDYTFYNIERLSKLKTIRKNTINFTSIRLRKSNKFFDKKSEARVLVFKTVNIDGFEGTLSKEIDIPDEYTKKILKELQNFENEFDNIMSLIRELNQIEFDLLTIDKQVNKAKAALIKKAIGEGKEINKLLNS